MSIQNTDLLLVQRDDTPYKETAENLATYINGQITFPTFPDAVVFQGLWSDEDNAPAPDDRENGYLWIWNGGDATLNDAGDEGWVGINGESITDNDRIYWDGSAFQIFPVGTGDGTGGGTLVGVTAGNGITVSTTAPGSATSPAVSAKFGAVASGTPDTVMPYDISMLAVLPDPE